jgi:putative Mg2+ transporter-C (MgtC) family protein
VLAYPELIARLGAAVAIGCAIGVNREVRGKPTGVRTLGLVALGAALAVIVSAHLPEDAQDRSVSRAVQGVLTGVGFLGAGVILKDGASGHVQGLTTAASIWLTACLGLVCGLGAWKAVLVSSGLIALLLTVGGRIDHEIHRRWRTRDEEKPPFKDLPS